MARVDYTKIYSEPSDNIYNLIDTRTNVADPRDPQNIKNRQFVYHTEPQLKAMDFKQFPYIVVEDARLDSPTSKTADARKEYLRWTQTITVRHSWKGAGNNRTDQGHIDMRNIINDIIKTLKGASNKAILRDYDMFNVDLEITNIDTVTMDEAILYETTLEVTYATMMAVTA